MSIKDWPHTERPREKLLNQGAHFLSNAELLAIFLRTGCAGKSAIDLAKDLLSHFGGLRELLDANQEQFCQVKGLGMVKYVQLQATLEIGKRHLAASLSQPSTLNSSKLVKQYLTSQLRHREREIFSVLFLNSQHQLIAYEELFYGTLDSASIHPREIAKRSLSLNAAAVILAHNHPSGIAEPSQPDIQITRQIKDSLNLIEVRTLDHMIVGNGAVTSLAERGLM